MRKKKLARLTAQVEQAATYLDHYALGWHRQMDVGRLDMRSQKSCVLGQLYGRYGHAPGEILRNTKFRAFCPLLPSTAAAVRELWTQQIELRRYGVTTPAHRTTWEMARTA